MKCPKCKCFVHIDKVILDGLEQVIKILVNCKRCGEQDAINENWDYDALVPVNPDIFKEDN